eukprot:SM000187S03879  [mRNA]  locus=s187:161324:165401:+ [translate_table: standard]
MPVIAEVGADGGPAEAAMGGALGRLEQAVADVECAGPAVSDGTVALLRGLVDDTDAAKLSEEHKLQLWKLAYRIWNACVEVANTCMAEQAAKESHARLRHVASDMLLLAGEVPGVTSGLLKVAFFFCRTGKLWHALQKYEVAEACFEKATALRGQHTSKSPGAARSAENKAEEDSLSFDLHVARARTAWELSQSALACSLLGRARSLVASLSLREKYAELSDAYFQLGRKLVVKETDTTMAESVHYLDNAYDICSDGLAIMQRASSQDLTTASKAAMIELQQNILRFLAAAHVHNKNFDAALKCTAGLKDPSVHVDHPSIPCLEAKALLGLQRYDEAETELQYLVAHELASPELCLAAFEDFLCCNKIGRIKRAFHLVQAKAPTCASLPVKVLEKLLTSRDLNGENEEEALRLTLAIATNEQTLSAVCQHDTASCRSEMTCVFTLLWNRASAYFQAKTFEKSKQLMELAMLYLPPSDEEKRAKALRGLCLCHMGLQQYDRASELVNSAEQKRVEDEAIEQVEKMLTCPDFEPDYLTLACHEAIACKCNVVAVQALKRLLDLFIVSQPVDVVEAVIARNIISLCSSPMSGKGGVEGSNLFFEYHEYSRTRLADIGFERFFGSGSIGQKEARWFASSAWHCGLDAGRKKENGPCSFFFEWSAELYAALPDSVENLHLQKLALLVAAGAHLSCSDGDEEKRIRAASQHLKKCTAVSKLQELLQHILCDHYHLASQLSATISASGGDLHSEQDANLFMMMLLFDVHGRNNDHKAQLAILKKCEGLPKMKAEFLLQLGEQARGKDKEKVEVALTAFRMALIITLTSATPDYGLTAMLIRKMIQLADLQQKDGPDVLVLYEESRKILASLPAGEYSKEEAQWLVATSWNRASSLLVSGRKEEAAAWMQAAVELLEFAPSISSCKQDMLESLERVKMTRQTSEE